MNKDNESSGSFIDRLMTPIGGSIEKDSIDSGYIDNKISESSKRKPSPYYQSKLYNLNMFKNYIFAYAFASFAYYTFKALFDLDTLNKRNSYSSSLYPSSYIPPTNYFLNGMLELFAFLTIILGITALVSILANTIHIKAILTDKYGKHVFINSYKGAHLWGWFIPFASIWIVPNSLKINKEFNEPISNASNILRWFFIFIHLAPILFITVTVSIFTSFSLNADPDGLTVLSTFVYGLISFFAFYILGYYFNNVVEIINKNKEAYNLGSVSEEKYLKSAEDAKEARASIRESFKNKTQLTNNNYSIKVQGTYGKLYEIEQLLKDGLINEEEFQELKRRELGL